MESYPRKDKLLAIFFTLAALFIIFVWVPMDTGTGLVEKVRRKYTIGDALAPYGCWCHLIDRRDVVMAAAIGT